MELFLHEEPAPLAAIRSTPMSGARQIGARQGHTAQPGSTRRQLGFGEDERGARTH